MDEFNYRVKTSCSLISDNILTSHEIVQSGLNTHLFISKLIPEGEGRPLENRDIVIFNRTENRQVVPITSSCTSSLSGVERISSAARCLGVPSHLLQEHLTVKFSRNLTLSLLMIALPYSTGCPVALKKTCKQGGKGYGGDEALHSSSQPGVVLYHRPETMVPMLQNLLENILTTKTESLKNILNCEEFSEQLWATLLSYDISVFTSILHPNSEGANILERAAALQDRLVGSMSRDAMQESEKYSVWLDDNRGLIEAYGALIAELQSEMRSLKAQDLIFQEGDNLLEECFIELSHAAVDVLPPDLNRLDSDIFEVRARGRLEQLEHHSALGTESLEKLVEIYRGDIAETIQSSSSYLQTACDHLEAIHKLWPAFCKQTGLLEQMREAYVEKRGGTIEQFSQAYIEHLTLAAKLCKLTKPLLAGSRKAESLQQVDYAASLSKLSSQNQLQREMDPLEYSLADISQLAGQIFALAVTVVSTAEKGILCFNTKEVTRKKGELIEQIYKSTEEDLSGLLQKNILAVRHLLNPTEDEKECRAAQSWIEKGLAVDLGQVVYQLYVEQIDIESLRERYLSLQESRQEGPLLDLMKDLCIYLGRDRQFAKPIIQAQAELLTKLYGSEEPHAFKLLFSSSMHGVPIFTDKNAYSFGQSLEKKRSSLLNEKTLPPLAKELFAAKKLDIEALDSFLKEMEAPQVEYNEQVNALYHRLVCARYLMEALTSALSYNISPGLKKDIREYIDKKVTGASIKTGSFLVDAMKLLLPKEESVKNSHGENLSSFFFLLFHLASADKVAKANLADSLSLESVQANLQTFFSGEKSDSLQDQSLRFVQMTSDFSTTVLPTYSSCLEGLGENSLKELLLSEIDSVGPTFLQDATRRYMSQQDSSLLAQFTLLSTISRKYSALLSGRTSPLLSNAVERGSEFALQGKVKYQKENRELTLKFTLPRSTIKNVGHILCQANLEPDVEGNFSPEHIEVVQKIAGCILADLANLETEGTFRFQIERQDYEKIESKEE